MEFENCAPSRRKLRDLRQGYTMKTHESSSPRIVSVDLHINELSAAH